MKRRSRMGQYVRVPLDIESRSETLRLVRLMGIPSCEAVCVLIRFMVWADLNADQDRRAQIDYNDLDTITRLPGFGQAAVALGLIQEVAGGVEPEIQVLTDLVDEQTFTVRRLEMDADVERKRLAKAARDFRRNSGGIPSEFCRNSDGESRAKQRSDETCSE